MDPRRRSSYLGMHKFNIYPTPSPRLSLRQPGAFFCMILERVCLSAEPSIEAPGWGVRLSAPRVPSRRGARGGAPCTRLCARPRAPAQRGSGDHTTSNAPSARRARRTHHQDEASFSNPKIDLRGINSAGATRQIAKD